MAVIQRLYELPQLAFTVTTLEKPSSLGKASEPGFTRFKPCAVDSVAGETEERSSLHKQPRY
jgi:hypothetical protein